MMTCKEKLSRAMNLLERIEDREISDPDEHWYRDYYLLTGNHMIFTTQGWLSGEDKQDYIDESGKLCGVLAEVNAPINEDGSLLSSEHSTSGRSTLTIVHRR